MTHSYWLRRLYGDPRRVSPGTLEGYGKPLLIPGSWEYGLKILTTWNTDLKELEGTLPRISDVPTLLLWGDHDAAVSPASAQILRGQFRECRLVVFPGVGHLPYEETPEPFSREVIEFLAGQK
jgi:pimeloyl-ACP methyl ester carboxylesterase